MTASLLRKFTSAALAGLVLVAAQAAAQGAFPSRPVRYVLPYGAGTSVDASARNLAARLASAWKQPVTVDNRPGANGIVAAQAVMAAPADGYTVISLAQAQMTINPFIYSKIPYDPVKDFVPISGVFLGPYVLVATNALPVTTLAGLVEHARKSPGAVTYASYGVGSGSHIAAEMFASMARIKLTHVPYTTNSIIGVIAGDVAVSWEPAATAIPHIKAGKLKALGVSSLNRMPSLPDVAPIAETVPGYESVPWVAVFAPANTPAAVVDRFSREVARIIAEPELGTEFGAIGLAPWPAPASAVERVLKADLAKHKELIERLGIKLE